MRILHILCMLAISATVHLSEISHAQHPIPFDVRLLTVDSNEGCDIADVDGDGALDVIAGRNWYRNGEWIPRPVRLIEDRDGYVRSNGEWAYDVNRDGRVDVISMDFVQRTVYWYENPGAEGLQRGLIWNQHPLVDTGYETNETSYLVDIDHDGTPEWISDQWNKSNPLMVWSFDYGTQSESSNAESKNTEATLPVLKGHRIGDSTGHGIAFGDLNNDSLSDIMVGTGWYERPHGNVLKERWRFHPTWDIQGSCPMQIYDVDGDKINDVIVSKAHGFGIHLWKGQGTANGEPTFQEILIDDSYSQAHCLHLADLDGDNHPELITGRRVRAHNGRDPGENQPPLVKYYVWNKDNQRFDGHVIEAGSVGIGLQIRTADLDGDDDLDIVVAGKDGTQILFNRRLD